MTPEAGALGIGGSSGDISWWSNSASDVFTRACYFDDIYRFEEDGTFANLLGEQTWLETIQGVSEDKCGTPIAPHDGSHPATFAYSADSNTLSVQGLGAFLGVFKAHNTGEYPVMPVDNTIEYSVHSHTDTTMQLRMNMNNIGWWTFRFRKLSTVSPPPSPPSPPPPPPSLPPPPSAPSAPGFPPIPAYSSMRYIHAWGEDPTSVSGFQVNPAWGQQGSAQVVHKYSSAYPVAGQEVIQISNLNYQGHTFSAVNITGFTHVSVSLTADIPANVSLFLIKSGTGDWTQDANGNWYDASQFEQGVALPEIQASVTNTFTLPLTDFPGIPGFVDQLKWEKVDAVTSPTFQFTNLVFHTEASTPSVEGVWKLSPTSGALGVGPSQGNTDWFTNSVEDLATRDCLFDDLYRFDADGNFSNFHGANTWVEPWQGASSEGCGTPVAPHDGSNNPASYTHTSTATEHTLTVLGAGAYIGAAKVHNTGEDGSPVGDRIVYTVSELTDSTMVLDVSVGYGWWRYRLVRAS